MSDTSVIFSILAIDKASEKILGIKSAFGLLAVGVAAGAAAAGAKAVQMAADFQTATTRLVTGAGESQSNIKKVGDGILSMSGQVGQSAEDLAKGMYLVESAGYHGADALKVLKAAAEGAKVGNADLGTTADAVTTVLNAYHMGAGQAAEATNALIAAEGQGKTNLEALAGSMSTVLPIASAAHVGLNEVLGAMSTMTAEGTPAADAATYLKQTIGQLSNPSGKAAQEMKSLGLNAVDVSRNLGTNGLASTLTMLTDAIQSKMGPAGTVLIEHLKNAAKNTTAFQQVLAKLPPAQQTYVGALANMVGGTKSMQAALELTGPNMQTFKDNTAVIGEKVKNGGQSIEGWALVQKTFNQRMAEATATVGSLGIRIGNGLLPYAQQLLGVIMSGVNWFSQHKAVAQALAVVIGTLTGSFLAYKTALLVISTATKAWTVIQRAAVAVQWLLNVAMDANPIGLIIIAIVALVAGIVLLWTHSKAFRDFFIGLWGDIWTFLKGVGHWFANDFVDFFKHAWQWISDETTKAKDWIVGKFHEVVLFVTALPGQIRSAAVGMWDGIKDAFRSALDWLIGKWNSLRFGIPQIDTHIPGIGVVGGFSFGVPQIPYMAQGGTVSVGGLAVVGEKGPELVALPSGAQVYPHGTGPAGSPRQTTVTFNGNTDSAFATAFMRLVRTGLVQITTS